MTREISIFRTIPHAAIETAARLDRIRKPVARGKTLPPSRKKRFWVITRAIITLISAESRVSKTISILMGGSRVNPFIGVGQIRIALSLSLSLRAVLAPRGRARKRDGGSALKALLGHPRESREINMTNYPEQ